jgi:subtilase family serine protease
MGNGRLTCLLAGAGLVALAAGIIPAIPSEATAVPPSADGRISAAAHSTLPLPAHALRVGALAGRTVMHADVTLTVRDPGALTEFIKALSSRRSPMFHHFLRRGQFGQRFGATAAEIAQVDRALRAAGLSPGRVSANRLSIPVTASAAAIERAFHVGLTRYRLAGGQIAYTNSATPRIPASISRYVQGVLGLSDLYLPQNHLVRITRAAARTRLTSRTRRVPRRMAAAPHSSGPQPCSSATTQASEFGSYTANQLAAYYGMTPLYAAGDLGQGVHVAFAEFEPNLTTDIAQYESCYGITTAVTYHTVGTGPGTGAGSGEAALDIEDIMGLAPDVSIDVYQGPNGGDTDTYDMYNAIVTADADQVISTSWGTCELDSDSSLISSEDTLVEQAATQGQTFLAAAGDDGSTDCNGDGSTNAANLSVDDPGSQPGVVSVGGTTISSGGESVWNDSTTSPPAGAGGGGISADWCMPAYQYQTSIPGLVNADSQTNSACSASNSGDYLRQVPDVAADADPYSGYVIYYDGSWEGGWGGTSAAAPLWAAVAALIDASPFCADYGSGAAGAQPEGLYVAANALHSYIYQQTEGVPEVLSDVTGGENDYTPSGYTGGLYPATVGYDQANGLGTPLVTGYDNIGDASTFYPGLAALMCFAYGTKGTTTTITGLSPATGSAGNSHQVTVSGTGFLPIAGADEAAVTTTGGTLIVIIPANCPSSTRCTVDLPPLSAGKVDIEISAEDLTLSKVTSASQFTYGAAKAKAPTVSSLSPDKGKAGIKITIRGSNFSHVTAVHFGSKKATKVKVESSTKIVVTVPKGSGTVSVTVTTSGGKSKITKACRYKYT